MLTFFIFLLILGVLIIIHEFGHFIIAKKVGVKVEKFSLGFGPVLWSRKVEDTLYTVALIPLGGFVKLAGDSIEEYKGKTNEYFSKNPGQRAAIIFFGPLLNYILGFACFWMVFFIGYPTLTSKVGGLMDGFGAKDAGIEIGDKIVAIDGAKVEYWDDISNLVRSKKDANTALVSVIRKDQAKQIEVKLKQSSTSDPLGQKRSVGVLGITPYYDEVVTIRQGFFKSFALSSEKTWNLTVLTYKSLWRMITGKLSFRDSVTGPLGIYIITSKVAHQGLGAILSLMGLLSISLCIFNLLPLPVLDGGHILLLFVEKIRGKTLSVKSERVITNIGVTLIITLAVLVTYYDLARIVGPKIAKLLTK